MEKNRVDSIDVLRGFAIILVVLGHTIEKNGQPNSFLYNSIYSFHMPLFMFISGFVTKHSYRLNSEFNKKHILYVFKKFKNIMIPYLVWALIINPLFFKNITKTIDYNLILESVFITNTSFWFLPCLFGLIIVFSIFMGIQRFFKTKQWLIDPIILIALMAVIIVIYYFTHNDFIRSIQSYFIPFFIGVLAAKHKKLMQFIFSNNYVYAFTIILFSLTVGLYGKFTGAPDKIIRLTTGILALPICFNFVRHTNIPSTIKKQLIFIGQHTLVIYVMHFNFIHIFNFPFSDHSNILANSAFLFFALLITYACIIFSKFFEPSPTLKLFVLGKK